MKRARYRRPSPALGVLFFTRFWQSLRTHLRNHAYGIAAVLIALGGTAYAATSFVGSDGKVRGCVSKKGQLTVLKPPKKKCAKGTAITWNQKGRVGQTGAQGPQG